MKTLRKEILISRKEIKARVQDLAEALACEYKGKEPVLLGILNGAVFFFVELAMAMQIPTKIDFIRAASYGSGMVSKGTIRFTKDAEIPLSGEDVILIEDIVDTGRTLTSIIENIKAKEPASLKVCALIDKVERREVEVHIDYCGFKVNEGFLVGYGLDHDERFRCLPDIYVLR